MLEFMLDNILKKSNPKHHIYKFKFYYVSDPTNDLQSLINVVQTMENSLLTLTGNGTLDFFYLSINGQTISPDIFSYQLDTSLSCPTGTVRVEVICGMLMHIHLYVNLVLHIIIIHLNLNDLKQDIL